MKNPAQSALHAARLAKHAAWVMNKELPQTLDMLRRIVSPLLPHTYSGSDYTKLVNGVTMPNSSTFMVNHLAFDADDMQAPERDAPDKLFVIWAGPNNLSEARKHSLEVIRKSNPDLNVHFITHETVSDYILDGFPLHRAYDLLSYVHRSDYLRAYLMHHHGGAYCDIKPMNYSWKTVIDRLNALPAMWAAGPDEKSSFNVSPASGPLGRHQKLHFASLLYPAAFAFKPGSAWTQEWLAEVDRRLN